VSLAAVAAILLTGALLTPLGVQALMLNSELRGLSHQRELQDEILSQRSDSLERLQRRVESARSLQQQISLILGAPQESTGLGGFPDVTEMEVSVAAARTALDLSNTLNTESKALLTLADELASFARDNQELTGLVPSICPLPIGSFVLTSPFGDRVSPFTNSRDFHAGIDLAAREGTPIMAAGKGRVVFAGRFPLNRNVRWWRYGNVVVLNHGDRYLSIYAHMEDIGVRRGQQVDRGEEIGTVGNTGWSTSPHLHYEIRVMADEEGEPTPADPRIYILNYQWKGHEAILIAGRHAPPPSFDPLPSRLKVR
jgi:murein DD-endopeptidase MepM/ murein hydrolase activator NlpD